MVSDEIAAMKSAGFWYVERPGFYIRNSDGARVVAADWPDGDISWLLDPMPIIAPVVVGTVPAAEFAEQFTRCPSGVLP